MGIHKYKYYDTRTHSVNIWVLKIFVPLTADINLQYLFFINCRFYPQIPISTNFFDIST